MHTPANYVLIEPYLPEFAGSSRLIVPEYIKNKDINVFKGRVKQVPEQLIYMARKRRDMLNRTKQNPPLDALRSEIVTLNSMGIDRDTDMELEVGDDVWFSSHAYADAKTSEWGRSAFIRYDYIYCAKRQGQLIPINGNILVQPLKKKLSSKIQNTEYTSEDEGVIQFVGKPCREHDGHFFGDPDNLVKGHHIIFKKKFAVKIEHETFATLPQVYHVLRGIDVMGVAN